MGAGACVADGPRETHPDLQLQDAPLFKELLGFLKAGGAESILADKRPFGAGDALLVIDMQNDFIPNDDIKQGGRFAVAEGDLVAPLCAQLIEKAIASGSSVVATRDYHPKNHCSFLTDGGHFPPHCVQGTPGSKLYPSIAKAMTYAISATMKDGEPDGRASIAFKGFHEDIDSFGGLPYKGGGEGRISRRETLSEDPITGCEKAPWTGCVLCNCSALHFDGQIDVDAPPDMLAMYQHKEKVGRVEDLVVKLKALGAKRLLVCGLALDFCVCDTALNGKEYGFEDVQIVLDAARPAHIPGLGSFGSGFLQDPADLVRKLKEAGVKLTSTVALTGEKLAAPCLERKQSRGFAAEFPQALHSFCLDSANELNVSVNAGTHTFTVAFEGTMQVLSSSANEGKCSPLASVTLDADGRKKAGIPDEATEFVFAYPLESLKWMDEAARTKLWMTRSHAGWRFVFYGGFVYLNAASQVCACTAIGIGDGIHFGTPLPWKKEFTKKMNAANRFQPITLKNLLAAGACHFTWISAGESLEDDSGNKWVPAEHGAFAYLFSKDTAEPDDRDCFFHVV